MQDESKKAEDQKSAFLNRLQAADTTKQSLEQKMSEMIKIRAQLEAQIAADKQRSEDSVTRLETEIESLKARLMEKCQSQVREKCRL